MMQVVIDTLKIMVTFLFEKAALGTTFYWGSKIANGNNRQSKAAEKIALAIIDRAQRRRKLLWQ